MLQNEIYEGKISAVMPDQIQSHSENDEEALNSHSDSDDAEEIGDDSDSVNESAE